MGCDPINTLWSQTPHWPNLSTIGVLEKCYGVVCKLLLPRVSQHAQVLITVSGQSCLGKWTRLVLC